MMKQQSQERAMVAAQLQDSVSGNLKSYIQDLKKVATTNKQKRAMNQQSQSYLKSQNPNYPQSTKNSGNMQMIFMNNPLGMSQNIIQQQNNNMNNSAMLSNNKILIQSDQELMLNQTQILSPRQSNILSSQNGNLPQRPNMLNNKALAYLNSKKANSILKSYEEAINTNKFIQNQGSKNGNNKRGNGMPENSQANIGFNERGRSQQKSRGGMRNHNDMVLQSEEQNYPPYSAMMSPVNINPQQYANMKSLLENNFNQTQQIGSASQQQQRPQKEVIIRKQSSKSLLKNAKEETPVKKQSQQVNRGQQRVLSQVTTNRQDLIITDSTAGQITNDTSSMTRQGDNPHHRKLGSHNFVIKTNAQNSDAGTRFSGNDEGDSQKALMKKIHTLGNSLGAHKKSLNISQQFGDSINDLTLAKTGKINNLNLSSLLKSHLLDDDGIEDLHFYFVSFNHHKQGILKQHEVGAIKVQNDKHQKHKKSNSSTAVNIKPNTNLQQPRRDEIKQSDKTIETVDEEDLF
ncbi:UNKNOWN [Stylonychia lemnae]|uniref:Uncharacterized protein n=1 Tax=Stylonychia lemnae TaxID=5949 RepID=A0A078A1H4_STYLE|nr:UNKNOWN [Stylonychia lemnae]|eukprot:CDW76106.1 UNKNOWN [Stylonychia lemnae]